jgi:hypothetical protein
MPVFLIIRWDSVPTPVRASLPSSTDVDVSRSAAPVALGGHDHVVVTAQVHAVGRPGVEVVGGRDSARGALRLADGPVLVKGGCALDGGGVVPGGLVDVVVRAVRVYRADEGGAGGGVVAAEVLDDVVLDQRAGGPPVEREVRVARRAVVAAEVDGPRAAGVPPLAGYEVVAVLPDYLVLALGEVLVLHAAAAGVPEGVVVAVVISSLAVADGLACLQLAAEELGGVEGEGGHG